MSAIKTVLVTGSSRGIGLEIARKFLSEGHRVIINGFNSPIALKQAFQELKHSFENVYAIHCDVSNNASVDKMFKEIEATFGGIDVLINNAAISHVGLFSEMSQDEITNLIDVNFLSVINCSKRALTYMLLNKCGYILNISSIWGQSGASCEVVYSATKGAVDAFSKALGKELALSGITVNSLALGAIDTDMNSFLNKEERLELSERIPIGRLGCCSEVADFVYLLCKSSSYLTGEVITFSGGFR